MVTTEITNEQYAIFNNDCLKVLPTLPDDSIDFSIYSPPFASLYNYSSQDEDMSNCKTYDEFLEHYEFLVKQISRVTKPGRLSAVHCFDIPKGINLVDFPGDIVRLHQKHGFHYHDRKTVWKEPLHVAIKTRSRGLMHKQIVKDSTLVRSAIPDSILIFRKAGTNEVPVAHPLGLTTYAGERQPPEGLKEKYKNWSNPRTNKWSHWIWQQYASNVWMDIRLNKVLAYKPARDVEDEKHVCPLMTDIIERLITLYSNEGETVLTPFLGVGSEVYCSVRMNRKAIGIELKPAYFRQAIKNIALGLEELKAGKIEMDMFDNDLTSESFEDENEVDEEELIENES